MNLSTKIWRLKDGDTIQLHVVGRLYNRLIEEKFMLMDRMIHQRLPPEERVNLRMQLAALSAQILRLDNIRGLIAFNWKYENVAPVDDFGTLKKLKEYQLHTPNEYLIMREKFRRYQQHLSEANKRLRSAGLEPVTIFPTKKEVQEQLAYGNE